MRQTRAIPRDDSLPVIGRSLGILRDPLASLQRIEHRHGKVVWCSWMGQRLLCLFGPDALELVLRNRDDAFSSRLGWQRWIEHVFPGAIMTMDGDQHRVQRRIMQAAFTRSALSDYVARMNVTVGRKLASWLPGDRARDRLLAYPAIKRLTLDAATEVFMGVEAGPESERINRAFEHAVEASMAIVRTERLPLSYRRGRQGRAVLVAWFRSLLADKRAHRLPDLFSQMCHAEDEAGARFTDEEVVDHMIFLMMAAHDTTTCALTAVLYLLARHPEWQQRLRLASLERDDELTLDDVEQLDEAAWVIDEALRIYPPVAMIPRQTVAPVAFDGFELPAGALVNLVPIAVHHMPSLWTRPERFDPERFAPGRAEHKRHRFAFAPFGGGPHVCIGQHFATLELKLALHQILRRYRWYTEPGYQMPYQVVPIGKPRDGLPLYLERL